MKSEKLVYVLAAVLIVISSCTRTGTIELKNGIWRGVLTIQGNELPMNFEVEVLGINPDSGYLTLNGSNRNIVIF